MSPSPAPASRIDGKILACRQCTERKVRCNKQQPCQSCIKSKLDCEYRSQSQAQRRKRRIENVNQALLQRLRTQEVLLRHAGLSNPRDDDLDELDIVTSGSLADDGVDGLNLPPQRSSEPPAPSYHTPQSPRPKAQARPGLLVPEYGGKRYFEHGLLPALASDYKQQLPGGTLLKRPGESTASWSSESPLSVVDSLAGSFINSKTAAHTSLSSHFLAAAISKYWHVFLNNVHPLTKIIHAPTMHARIFTDASTATPSLEALRLAIFASAVASMSNNDCQRTFGESQLPLLQQLQAAAQASLQSAMFITVPDLDLLRAYALMITASFGTSEPLSLWILLGSAMRIAQSQGLHRDCSALGLSAFETEYRRRLWWYLLTIDSRLAELSGSKSVLPEVMDNGLPLNVDDAELDPNMSELPTEHSNATEMTFCLLSYEITRYLHGFDPWTTRLDLTKPHKGRTESLADLENAIEENYLRFCDPIIPLQLLTTVRARSMLCKLKLLAQVRIKPENGAAPPPTAETLQARARNWQMAVRNIEYDNLVNSNRSLQGFVWHTRFYFPLGSPITVLRMLTAHPDWEATLSTAWDRIVEYHAHHAESRITEAAIHLVINRMTLDAWNTRASFLRSKDIPCATPSIIADLQHAQDAFWARQQTNGTLIMPNDGPPLYMDDFTNFDFFDDISAFNFNVYNLPT